MHINVPRLNYDKLRQSGSYQSSAQIRQKVVTARQLQTTRFSHTATISNSEMNARQVEMHCGLGLQAEKLIKLAVDKFNLSARSYHRLLKISRTIADIDQSPKIKEKHLAEALQYRSKIES